VYSETEVGERVPRAVAVLAMALGGLAVLSACLINPWVARWYHKRWFDHFDVAFEYTVYALVVAAVLVVLGVFVGKCGRWVNALLLFISLTVIILADRALLVYWGRSPWVVDSELYYRHRSGITHTFPYWYGGHASTLAQSNAEQRFVRINSFGHHDDEFEREPKSGELRGVMIGDSVTMGHGVERGETFANQLEGLIDRFTPGGPTSQVVNAGVQGYDTEQEVQMFIETMAFKPRFAFVGFCVNDVPLNATEPTRSDPLVSVQKFGWALRYLLTETGIGLSVQKYREHQFSQKRVENQRGTVERRRDIFRDRVKREPLVQRVTDQLQRIYQVGKERGVDVILLVLPAREQLFQSNLQEINQEFVEHARQHGIPCIDMTTEIEGAIRLEIAQQLAGRDQSTLTADEMLLLYEMQANVHYLDGLHFTKRGHQIIAWKLARYLNDRYNLNFPPAAFAQAARSVQELPSASPYNIVIPPDYQSVIRLCSALEQLGKYQRAISVYEAVLWGMEHPGMRSALNYLLGKNYLALGDRKAGVKAFRHSVESLQAGWPRALPGAYTQFALDLMGLDLLEEAVVAFEKALVEDPQNLAARANLGWAFYSMGDAQMAIDQYLQARVLGDNSVVEFNLGLAYLYNRDLERAEEVYAGAVGRFGAEEGARIGAVEDIRELAAGDGHIKEAALQILRRYW